MPEPNWHGLIRGSRHGRLVGVFASGLNLMAAMARRIRFAASDEDGQGLAEYALILVLIAVVAILALAFMGTNLSTMLSKVGNSV
jgi:pilus assembly protein Flp/PilA